jgi:hypothetical protein
MLPIQLLMPRWIGAAMKLARSTTFNPEKMLSFVIFSLVKIRAQVSRGHARRPFFN